MAINGLTIIILVGSVVSVPLLKLIGLEDIYLVWVI